MTVFGGLLSIVIIGTFIGIFAGTFISVVGKKKVTSSEQIV